MTRWFQENLATVVVTKNLSFRATPLESSPDVTGPAVIREEEDPDALLTNPAPPRLRKEQR